MRLPNGSRRPIGLKLKLLLLGGVFSFAALAAAAVFNYRIVRDDLSRLLPDDALAALTIVEERPETFAFIQKLPAGARDMFGAVTRPTGSETVVFAVKEDDGLAWGLLTDGAVKPAAVPGGLRVTILPKGRSVLSYSATATGEIAALSVGHDSESRANFKLIRRDVLGFGFVRPEILSQNATLDNDASKFLTTQAGQAMPVSLSAIRGGIKLMAGRDYVGLPIGYRQSSALKATRVLPPWATAVVRTGAASGQSAQALNLASSLNLRPYTGFSALLGLISGPAEVLLGPANGGLPAFTLHAKSGSESGTDTAIIAAIRDLIGVASPSLNTIILSDKTQTIERRSSASSVEMLEKSISGGRVRRLSSADKSVNVTYFVDNDGSFWISDSAERIAGLMASNVVTPSPTLEDCSHNGSDLPTVIILPANQGSDFPLLGDWLGPLSALKGVRIEVNNLETGLFTMCGYL